MEISPKLAALNAERFKHFDGKESLKAARPALYTFKGDVYAAMRIAEYGAKERTYAQKHLRILSGLYGVLRPLDAMQPYRLEMGTNLKNPRGKDLYTFWGSRIAEALNRAAEAAKANIIINLASQEYAAAVDRHALAVPMLDVAFKERKGNTLKTVGLLAKRARGAMADHAIRHGLKTPAALQQFTGKGYRFDETLSSDEEWVFVGAAK